VLTAAGVGTSARTSLSEIDKEGDKKDAKPETKKRNNYDLNPKNKDGLDSKWQHSGKKDAKLETKKQGQQLRPRPQE
jgi:hypothetical protein